MIKGGIMKNFLLGVFLGICAFTIPLIVYVTSTGGL